jgi:uncharacterized membrane protein YedE/YeeE
MPDLSSALHLAASELTLAVGALVLLMVGAFMAASLAHRLAAPVWPSLGGGAASLIGGLLLGYGAVLAAGCNVSAFFGGIASGSLHGWVWIAPALLGNAVGLRLRPLFGLGSPAA